MCEREQKWMPKAVIPPHAAGITHSYGTLCLLAVLQSCLDPVSGVAVFTVERKCRVAFYKEH